MIPSPPVSRFAQSFSIGRVLVPNRLVLAPMAGLTSSAYRRHMKSHGVGLVVTEMVSSQGLLHGNARTADYLAFAEAERPLAVQLFGNSPDVMARAAEVVLAGRHVPDMLDINMGCPVRKVVKTGAGSALLGDPARAVEVAAAVVRVASACGVPVMAKIRAGLHPGDGLGLKLASRLEAAGIAALGVHARSASEYYRGHADHSVTAAIQAAVSIPVLASGDVVSLDSAERVAGSTGVAAVMLGRGVTGNPWLADSLLRGAEMPRPSLPDVVADLRGLLALAVQERGQQRAACWIRKLLTWYLRPSRVPATLIAPIRSLGTAREVDDALAGLVASCEHAHVC